VLNAILCLLPAVLVALPLLARRYPGDRTLIALRGDHQRPWPRARSSSTAARSRTMLRAAHGGMLIACSLAVRPPPKLIAAS
jgi:hypothetical protein